MERHGNVAGRLNVMRPSWVAENPAMEVAFHVDPGYGRRHVD
jgi:hypothetical protein